MIHFKDADNRHKSVRNHAAYLWVKWRRGTIVRLFWGLNRNETHTIRSRGTGPRSWKVKVRKNRMLFLKSRVKWNSQYQTISRRILTQGDAFMRQKSGPHMLRWGLAACFGTKTRPKLILTHVSVTRGNSLHWAFIRRFQSMKRIWKCHQHNSAYSMETRDCTVNLLRL